MIIFVKKQSQLIHGLYAELIFWQNGAKYGSVKMKSSDNLF